MRYTEHSRLRDLLEDPRAVAILERHRPGATTHPDLPLVLDMTLREISWYPEAGLSPATFQAILADLAML
jgi:hypothetical protein